MVSVIRMARPGGFSNLFSWRNITVSPPTFSALSPTPMVTGVMGGADASSNLALASSETCGQALNSAFPAASFIAKAKQVGTSHSPQFVFGSNLNISIPVSGIS